MKKAGAVALAALSLASFAFCGCGGDGKESGQKIVIYTGGSTEFLWRAGADEKAVWKEVQRKFKEDTGEEIRFEVNFLGVNMKDKASTALAGNGQVDIMISHTGGRSGIDDWMFAGDNYGNLYNDISDYGEKIIEYSTWNKDGLELNALERLRVVDGAVIGIPSVINPYKFGILVRKDWMEACGYTDDQEKAVSDSLTLVDNFEVFEEMALAMKNKYHLNYTCTGAIFDLEKAGVVGAYGLDAGYYTEVKYNEGGVDYIIPGGGQAGYSDIMVMENRWAKEGVLNPTSDTVQLDAGESEFTAGTTGIYFQDPTVTHLIKVARRCKAANPEAEFTVLGALTKDAQSTDKGFMRNSVATFGACVPRSSKNSELIVKYVNWMYSDVNNYLLCQYGIEGKHWQNNGDGTYSYLAPYSLTKLPYSGVLALVENQNVANLTCADYTKEELKWIETSQKKENYINNPAVDVMLLSKNDALQNKLWSAYNEIKTFCQLAWRGKQTGETLKTRYETNRSKFMNIIAPYGIELNNLYGNLKGALVW